MCKIIVLVVFAVLVSGCARDALSGALAPASDGADKAGAQPRKPVRVRIASICPSTHKDVVKGKWVGYSVRGGASVERACTVAEENLLRIVPLLEKAAGKGAKMACLPEDLLCLCGWLNGAADAARRAVIKRTCKRFKEVMSESAKRLDMVIVAGHYEVVDDKCYNAAFLFGADGRLIGTYHKIQLAGAERRWATPGKHLPVFTTRYGRVGMLICWDIVFPEPMHCLMLKGADIVFHPTYGHTGKQADFTAQARAHDTVMPLVVSMWCGDGRIIDCDGTILAAGNRSRNKKGLIPDKIIYADVTIGGRRKWLGFDDHRQRILSERRWKLFKVIADPPEGRGAAGE